jgi:DNA-binding beta-propeller fold protein YncE
MITRRLSPETWAGAVGIAVFAAVGLGELTPIAAQTPATRPATTATHKTAKAGTARARPRVVIDWAPVRVIEDANPTFNAIALNPNGKEVFIGNNNKASTPSIMAYSTQFTSTDRMNEPERRIAGPMSRLGDLCGLALSPEHKEIYTVQGEGASLEVFPMDGNGDQHAARTLSVSHGSADVFFDAVNDELFISTEHINRISVFRRPSEGSEPPVRYIQGPHTGLADPHGLFVDTQANELFVTNYGNYRETLEDDDTESNANEDRDESTEDKAERKKAKKPHKPLPLGPSTGKFVPPFIAVYPRTANGDIAPLRIIQGPATGLNLPLGITRAGTGEIVVANSGDNSLLFFEAHANGNVAPIRVVRGSLTNLRAPTGVAFDAAHNELWVTSWENHMMNVFSTLASGNAAPLRFLRSVAKGAPPATFGTPGAIAWDPKRKEILVPN